MKITKTVHVYAYVWELQASLSDGDYVPTLQFYYEDNKWTETLIYLCPMEVEVDLPDEEALRLARIQGVDKTIQVTRQELSNAQDRKRELLALPATIDQE